MAKKIIFLIILITSGLFRLVSLNWDDNLHLHPDERFLTMVATALKWPSSFSQYLDSAASPLNPHNAGYDFFVYGTWPVILVKAVAEWLSRGDYNQLTLIGRGLSAIADLGTLGLVFLITRRLMARDEPALLAASFYGLMVLPIQLSHFFAVDPYMILFLTLSFYILIYLIEFPAVILFIFLGLSFGLAVSAKISALLFTPIIALGFLISLIRTRRLLRLFAGGLLFLFAGYLTIRLAQPYLFSDLRLITFHLSSQVLDNWRQLKSFEGPDAWNPPATMWLNTADYFYPLENLLLWGLGLPLGLISISGTAYVLAKYRRHPALLVALWIIGLFAYQGGQFVKALRYFYALYPFLAIAAGVFIHDLLQKSRHKTIFLFAVYFLLLIWPLSFTSIYTRPHSRVTASAWIMAHIPPDSSLSCEHWDDCLPLGWNNPYKMIEFPLYGQDSLEKWQDMALKLNQVDYLILSSNRLYGSITSVPGRYPTTSRFYQSLFDGSLGFTKIAEFTSRPNLSIFPISACLTPPFISYGKLAFPAQACPLSGLSFVDDYSDESFTVYDHPKVIIFKKVSALNLDFLRK